MKNNKKISIKEIAKLSGVSVATVSRVINNNGRFSEETRQKVLDIIKKYDYTTNMAAKSLRVSKSKTIGVIVPDINNLFFAELVLEIENFFFEYGYSVFICNTAQNEVKEKEYFRSLDSKLVDGIICISSNLINPANFIKRNIPIVYLNNTDMKDYYCVESNHYEGGFLATEELIKNGCKRIVLLTNNKNASSVNNKIQGFKDALKKYNIPCYNDLILRLDLKEGVFEDSLDAINYLIDKNINFDGVFATNDLRAHSALVALQQHDIPVPNNVKIIGYDGTSISQYANPPISTIYQDKKTLATETSTLLLKLINEESKNLNKHLVIPIKLIKRKTT
ncbi:LacI family DNA-binding transcriptional regulator [Terrisporobacter sp.]